MLYILSSMLVCYITTVSQLFMLTRNAVFYCSIVC